MKKFFMTVFMVLCVGLCLCGCSQDEQKVRLYWDDSAKFEIDTENKTISDGMRKYAYSYEYTSDSAEITITYPDGSSWWTIISYSEDGIGTQYSGWSDDYIETKYVDGETLSDVVRHVIPRKTKNNENVAYKVIFGLIGVGGGIFMTASPYTVWYCSHGWKYEDIEPSDEFLGWIRALGIIILILVIGIMVFV